MTELTLQHSFTHQAAVSGLSIPSLGIPSLEHVRGALAGLCESGVAAVNLSLRQAGEWRDLPGRGSQMISASEMRELIECAEEAAKEIQCRASMRLVLETECERIIVSGQPGAFWYVIHLEPSQSPRHKAGATAPIDAPAATGRQV